MTASDYRKSTSAGLLVKVLGPLTGISRRNTLSPILVRSYLREVGSITLLVDMIMKTMIWMTLALFATTTVFAQTTVKVISSGSADDTVKVIESGFADITVKFVRDQTADLRIAHTTDKSKADVIITRRGYTGRTVKVIDSGVADMTIKISDSGFSDITIGIPTSGKVHALIYTEDGFFDRRDVIVALLPLIKKLANPKDE